MKSFFDNSKRKTKKSGLHILCAICLIMIVLSGSVFAASKITSKIVYVSVLNNLAKKTRDEMSKIPLLNEKEGKFTYNRIDFNEDTKKKEDEEKFEVYFKGSESFIKDENFKALYNNNTSEVFVKELEKGKEIGDLLKYKINDFDDYGYQIKALLDGYGSYLNILEEFDVDESILEERRNQLEMTAIVLETIAKNLKDSYFVDTEKGLTNVYTLSLNNSQMLEFSENLIRDLAKNKRLLLLAKIDKIEDKDIDSFLSELKEVLNQIEDYKLTISIYTLDKVEDFVGAKISVQGIIDGKALSLVIDLNSNGTKALKSMEEFTGLISLKFGEEYDITINLKFDKKVVSVNGYASVMIPSFSVNEKVDFDFNISTADGKEFIQSTNIDTRLQVKSNDQEIFAKFKLKGNSDKSMIDSSEISLNGVVDNKEYKDIIRLYTEDKKSFKESSKIIFEMNDNNKKASIILVANDNKALSDSSDISLIAVENDNKMELLNVKANDKKAVAKSLDLTFSLSEEMVSQSMQIRIKSKDKKTLFNSSNIEMSFKHKIDGENIDFVITIKGDKQLMNSKKLDITCKAVAGKDKYNFSGRIESKDGKPINESLQMKYSFNLAGNTDGDTIKVKLDSEKGYDYEYKTSSSKETRKLVYQKVDLNKLMNTKNAKEANSLDVMRIIDTFIQ